MHDNITHGCVHGSATANRDPFSEEKYNTPFTQKKNGQLSFNLS
jgi:hypothetical protein